MKYKLIQKINPTRREEKKWYATTINAGTTTEKHLAERIAKSSSLTVGDVLNVLANFLEEVPYDLKDEKSVSFGDFGSFRVSLSSEGAEDAKKFSASSIKPKIIFTPGKKIKQALENISFEQSSSD